MDSKPELAGWPAEWMSGFHTTDGWIIEYIECMAWLDGEGARREISEGGLGIELCHCASPNDKQSSACNDSENDAWQRWRRSSEPYMLRNDSQAMVSRARVLVEEPHGTALRFPGMAGHSAPPVSGARSPAGVLLSESRAPRPSRLSRHSLPFTRLQM